MRMKLGKKAFDEGNYESPVLIPFTRYSVKPKQGSWVQKLIDDGRVKYISKE